MAAGTGLLLGCRECSSSSTWDQKRECCKLRSFLHLSLEKRGGEKQPEKKQGGRSQVCHLANHVNTLAFFSGKVCPHIQTGVLSL